MTIQSYLDELGSLRAGFDDVPSAQRAVVVRRSEYSLSALSMTRSGGLPEAEVHVFASVRPASGTRSVLRFPVDPTLLGPGEDFVGHALLFGVLKPGRAVACQVGEVVLWPVGPARLSARGLKWPR